MTHERDSFSAQVPRCYFCPAPSQEPITYVRWKNSSNHAFLCHEHREASGYHVAEDHPVAYGVQRLRSLPGW